jgi:hypothetical protein
MRTLMAIALGSALCLAAVSADAFTAYIRNEVSSANNIYIGNPTDMTLTPGTSTEQGYANPSVNVNIEVLGVGGTATVYIENPGSNPFCALSSAGQVVIQPGAKAQFALSQAGPNASIALYVDEPGC